MKAVYLEDRLHRRLRLMAADRGRSLKEIVSSMLERSLADESKGPDVSTAELQALAARGGSFDFLGEEREDVYSLDDGEAVE